MSCFIAIRIIIARYEQEQNTLIARRNNVPGFLLNELDDIGFMVVS
jgi:hypothetical protein